MASIEQKCDRPRDGGQKASGVVRGLLHGKGIRLGISTEQNAYADAGGLSCLHVALLVAKHDGSGRVDVVFFDGFEDHAGSGFSAAALTTPGGERLAWMVRTKINVGNRSAGVCKNLPHAGIKR